MKKITFPFLLLLLSMKAAAQCPDSFPLPYVMNTENVETPGLPDCMSGTFISFSATHLFESIPGPVEGFDGQLLAYDTTVEESSFTPFIGVSMDTWVLELEAGVNYQLSCLFGVSEGAGIIDSFTISVHGVSQQADIDIEFYQDIPGGAFGDIESSAFTVPVSGTYKINFTVDTEANNGIFYLDDLAIYEEGTMGINDNLLAGVTAYVDAATSKLIINADREVDSVELYTMAGQKVYSESVIAQTYEAEVGHLAQGIYLLNIYSGDSKKYMKIYKP